MVFAFVCNYALTQLCTCIHLKLMDKFNFVYIFPLLIVCMFNCILDAVKNKDQYDIRYKRFISDLQKRYDEINARQDGGAVSQLILWRER